MNKRGVIVGEVLLFVVELLLIGLCFVSLMSFVNTIAEGTLLEKNFLSKDISLLLNVIYASPNIVKATYYHDTVDLKDFILTVEDKRVLVNDIEYPNGIPKLYYYGYDPNIFLPKTEVRDTDKFDIANDGREVFIKPDLLINDHKLYCVKPVKKLNFNRLIIDPGNGGPEDLGFTYNQMVESKLNMQFAEALDSILTISHTMTRNDDYEVNRYDFIKTKVQDDLIISIHMGKYNEEKNHIKVYLPMERSDILHSFTCNLIDRLSEIRADNSDVFDSIAIFEIHPINIDKQSEESVLLYPNSMKIEIGNIESDRMTQNARIKQHIVQDFSKIFKDTLEDFKE